MPADVDFVPLGFDAAQGAFAHLAQIAQRRGVADERMDFLARGRRGLNGGKNQFQFLHDDALDLKEMVFIRRAEFFGAGDVDEMVELFPALDVGLDLGDQLVDFFGRHRRCQVGVWR